MLHILSAYVIFSVISWIVENYGNMFAVQNKSGDFCSLDQGVATFSLARGAISSPSIPGSLPATSRLSRVSSHFLAGPCPIKKTYQLRYLLNELKRQVSTEATKLKSLLLAQFQYSLSMKDLEPCRFSSFQPKLEYHRLQELF